MEDGNTVCESEDERDVCWARLLEFVAPGVPVAEVATYDRLCGDTDIVDTGSNTVSVELKN